MKSSNIKDSLYTYFIERWGMRDYTRGWLKGDCPFCGKEDKFGVHVGSNRVHCFYCDQVGTLIYTVAHIEKLTIPEARAKIGTFEGLKFKEDVVQIYDQRPVILPEGYNLITSGKSQVAKSARAYLEKKRKLNIQSLAGKGWGYCDAGPLFGYIIMPIYFRGQLVYYQTRNFLSSGPKFNNPKIEDFGIGKASLIYNVDSLWIHESVNLVESIINAETIGDTAIATLGKSVSSHQLYTILSSPVKRITIILDPDAFYEKALPLAFELIQYKQVKLLNLPEEQDVNSYGRTSTMLLKRRSRYLTYADLLKIKHKYEREAGPELTH